MLWEIWIQITCYKNVIKSTWQARYEPCIPVFQLPKAITLRPPGHYDTKCKDNEVVPVHVTQAYRGNTDITPLILNLRATRRWVVKITPPPALLPGKNSGTHWIYLVGPQRRSGHYGEEKNLLPLPCLSLITIRTKVSRLPDGNGTLNCIYIYIYIYITMPWISYMVLQSPLNNSGTQQASYSMTGVLLRG